MVAANAGNISCRISVDELLITPTMISKGSLVPRDILKIDLDGNILEGDGIPTSETFSIHLPLIRSKSEINAVVHAHPVYASVYLLTGKLPPRCALIELEAFFDKIRIIPFTLPGSKKLSQLLIKNLDGSDAFFLANHGVVTLGVNLKEAYYRMEVLEQSCKILYLSEQFGEITRIPEREHQKFTSIRQKVHNYFKRPY